MDKDKEKKKEAARRRYAANPEKQREAYRRRYAANPEKVREMKRRRTIAAPPGYVKRILRQAGIFDPPAWLVEAKRQQILLKRHLKEGGNEDVIG